MTDDGTMTDLEATKHLFTRIGVEYHVEQDRARHLVSFDRGPYDSKTGNITRSNEVYVDHEWRLEIKQGSGHAEMIFYYDERGKFVHQCGYEV